MSGLDFFWNLSQEDQIKRLENSNRYLEQKVENQRLEIVVLWEWIEYFKKELNTLKEK
jgi:hypothetical protein